MMHKFAIHSLTATGQPWHHVFDEVAIALNYGLKELGYDSVITNSPRLDRKYIILNTPVFKTVSYTIPENSILFNFEQLSSNSHLVNDDLMSFYKKHEVWDYSLSNINVLNSLNIKSKHVPIGYVKELEDIKPVSKDIDVFFFGSINQRRSDILKAIYDAGINVVAKFNIFGEQRNEFIARSKIIINPHYYESKIFEVVRVSYLLANKCCVISEDCTDTDVQDKFSQGVKFARYEDLASTVIEYLQDQNKINTLSENGYNLIKTMPQSQYLKFLGQQ
jgi:hypothetical protein